MRSQRRLAAIVATLPLFVLTLSFCPRAIHAATPAEPEVDVVEKAKQHFKRGVAFYKEGSFDAALAEFDKAYELRPDYRVLFNIGQVQAERHDYAAAIKALRRYMKDGVAEIEPARRTVVDDTLRDLATRVAELMVTANAPDLEVVVDGASAAILPLFEPLLVNAGIREVTVRSGARTAPSRRITLAGGDRIRLEFRIDPATTVATGREEVTGPSPLPSPRVESPSRTRAWVTFAAAGGLAVGTTVFALLARRANSDLDADLGQFPANKDRISNDRSRLKTWAGLTDGLGAATLIAAGLGFYFALSGPSGSDGETKHAAATELRLLPAGTGLAVAGTF